jgi:magnesium transporter
MVEHRFSTTLPSVRTSSDEDSHFDYFYDIPGSMPGTLNIEADAPRPSLC